MNRTVSAAGGGDYQTLINDSLRSIVEQLAESLETVVRRIVREELEQLIVSRLHRTWPFVISNLRIVLALTYVALLFWRSGGVSRGVPDDWGRYVFAYGLLNMALYGAGANPGLLAAWARQRARYMETMLEVGPFTIAEVHPSGERRVFRWGDPLLLRGRARLRRLELSAAGRPDYIALDYERVGIDRAVRLVLERGGFNAAGEEIGTSVE